MQTMILLILLNTIIKTVLFLGMSFPVFQQPYNNPAWVGENGITQFSQSKNTGLLAHNYKDGQYFSSLDIGSIVQVVMSDGSIVNYKITGIYRYQRPSLGEFIDLEARITYSDREIWNMFYNRDGITFQTCIERDGLFTWGILYVVGELLDEQGQTMNYQKSSSGTKLISTTTSPGTLFGISFIPAFFIS